MINQRITKLRQLMKERGIDLYIIPTSDFHQSEYVGSYFEARHYMSGFSGSRMFIPAVSFLFLLFSYIYYFWLSSLNCSSFFNKFNLSRH